MDGCILWEGYTDPHGYGRTSFKGTHCLAHRKAYCQHHGLDLADIAGQVVRHQCDTPRCINPQHLLLGSHADNARDKVARGRSTKGEASSTAKLTRRQVEEIKRRYTPRCRVNGGVALAREFGVSDAAVHHIIAGRNWAA